MQQIRSFSDWLVESAESDPVRLLELGLWAGPGVQWRLADRVDSDWVGVSNPEIGLLQIIYELDKLNRLGNSETWTLYPTSFGPARDIILAAWHAWQQSQDRADLLKLVGLVREHLHFAVRKYTQFKLTGTVPARHLRTGALLPPGEAPDWGEWYPLDTRTSHADLRPGDVPARRR